MNAAFNNLKGESQAQILQMDPEQRNVVMEQIILKSGRYSGVKGGVGGNFSQIQPDDSESSLIPYFKKLPFKNQLGALQGGYKAVSTEFSRLAENVKDTTTTIRTPESVQQTLEKQLPLLFIEKSDNKKDNTTSSNSTDVDTSDTTSDNDGNVKKITI